MPKFKLQSRTKDTNHIPYLDALLLDLLLEPSRGGNEVVEQDRHAHLQHHLQMKTASIYAMNSFAGLIKEI